MKIPTIAETLAILAEADPTSPVFFSDGMTPLLSVCAFTRPDVPRSLVIEPYHREPALAGDFADWLDFVCGTPFFGPGDRPCGRVSSSSPLVYDRVGGLVVGSITVDEVGDCVRLRLIDRSQL